MTFTTARNKVNYVLGYSKGEVGCNRFVQCIGDNVVEKKSIGMRMHLFGSVVD